MSSKQSTPKLQRPDEAEYQLKTGKWRAALADLSREELVEVVMSGAGWAEKLWHVVIEQEDELKKLRSARQKSGYARHADAAKVKEKMREKWMEPQWSNRHGKRGTKTAFAAWAADHSHGVISDPETVMEWIREWSKVPAPHFDFDLPVPTDDVFRLLMYWPKIRKTGQLADPPAC